MAETTTPGFDRAGTRAGTTGEARRKEFARRHPLTVYVLKRVVSIPVVLFLLSIATFSLTYLTPGSAVTALLGGRPSTPEAIAQIEAEYHLNGSLLTQYGNWLAGVFHFNFGTSVRTSQPVGQVLGNALPITIFLGIYALLIVIILGVALGVVAARFARSTLDRVITSASIIGISTPAFMAAVVLLYLFTLKLGWLPAYGVGHGFTDRAWHLTLPAFALAFSSIGLMIRFTRSAVIDVLEQDYVTFAKARGLSRTRIYLQYVLRNGIVPVVTASGLLVVFMLTSTILVEVTFATQGVGSLFASSVQFKDTPVLQALTLTIGLLIIITNLLADVLYIVLDPRQRRRAGGL
jgi:peptide/nickel transport system permease protein